MSFADALYWIASGFTIPAIPLSWVATFRSSPEYAHLANGMSAVGGWLAFLGGVLDPDMPAWVRPLIGVYAAVYTWLWWRNRRKGRRKKALKQLGAKSRARVEALVRQMTPSPIPSPAGGRS